MHDAPGLLRAMCRSSQNAAEEANPTGLFFGTVISTDPLKINVEQKLTLDSQHLILSTLVLDFDVDMTVDHLTEQRGGGGGDEAFASHDHNYLGRKIFRVHLGLNAGEKVMLMRVQGGQKYLVLDRIR